MGEECPRLQLQAQLESELHLLGGQVSCQRKPKDLLQLMLLGRKASPLQPHDDSKLHLVNYIKLGLTQRDCGESSQPCGKSDEASCSVDRLPRGYESHSRSSNLLATLRHLWGAQISSTKDSRGRWSNIDLLREQEGQGDVWLRSMLLPSLHQTALGLKDLREDRWRHHLFQLLGPSCCR